MYQPLVPCSACDRHVRTTHPACPFCAAPLPSDLARRAVPPAPNRLGRAAAFAFGASITLTACDRDVASDAAPPGSEGSTGGTIRTIYGGPPPPYDAGSPDDRGDVTSDAGGAGAPHPDHGGGGTLDGGPPPLHVDAGRSPR